MNKILNAWREFVDSEVIVEGGNASAKIKDPVTGEVVDVEYKGFPAVATPITFDNVVTRSQFVSDVLEAIKKIHKLHIEAFGEGLYESFAIDDILGSGYSFMGSSEFLFTPASKLSDEEYNRHKLKTGDIDLLVPNTKIESLFSLLNQLRKKALTDKVVFVGHNKLSVAQIREEQINGILEYRVPGRSFLFQIDFVFVPFDKEGKPFEEEKFLRGSSWQDIQLGIKGIGHKLLLQSLASDVKKIEYGTVFIATPSSKPEKVRLSTKFPKTLPRVGSIGEEGEDVPKSIQDFKLYLNEKIPQIELVDKEIDILFKMYHKLKKVSWSEIDRFLSSASNEENLSKELVTVLRGQGLAANQNVRLLIAYIVDAPVSGKRLKDYFDSTSSLASFSMGRGYSEKYAEEPYQADGQKVLRYQKFKEREVVFRKAEEIFFAIFGQKPDAQDVSDTASFTGLLRIITKYLSSDAIVRVFDRMIYHFYESNNRISRHDIEDDKKPKDVIMKTMVSAFGNVVSNSKKFKQLEDIKRAFYDDYKNDL